MRKFKAKILTIDFLKRGGSMKNSILSKSRFLAAAAVTVFFVCIGGPNIGIAAPEPMVHKFTPGMKMSDLAGRPDTDLMILQNGGRMSLGDIRKLGDKSRKIRAAVHNRRLPEAFKIKPGNVVHVSTRADLSAALSQKGATIEFNNGKRIPVAMIKELQPYIEKKLGRKLDMPGNTINVTAKSDLKSLLNQPDNTVLESPNGRKITVGELKQFMAQNKSRSLQKGMPSGATTPVKTPGKEARP
jgi:hypothetical protein